VCGEKKLNTDGFIKTPRVSLLLLPLENYIVELHTCRNTFTKARLAFYIHHESISVATVVVGVVVVMVEVLYFT